MEKIVDVAIVGAGFGGLGAAIRLKRETKKSFLVIERASDVGGTWRENTYPGCACDVPSNLYSYSFEQNPKWSRIYPQQKEILEYLRNCVKTYSLESDIIFDTEITKIVFDEKLGRWSVISKGQLICQAKVLVSATGPLNRPIIPNLEGLTTFKGTYWHSSRWNHDYDLKNKKVAVIGTGASAIQVVPNIEAEVRALNLFQRTPPWIIPKPDRNVSKIEHFLYDRFPFTQRLRRWWLYGLLEARVGSFTGTKWLNRLGRKQSLDHIKDQVKDDELRKMVTPQYEIGCKRVLVSSDYYPTLQKDHVNLITSSIAKISENGILTESGELIEADAIIFCTGFNASESMVEIDVTGLGGSSLLKDWIDSGPEAYHGLMVNKYPNLVMLVGPNTGLGHNSIIFMIEAQVNYLMDFIAKLDESGAKYMHVKEIAQSNFNVELQQRMQKTIWSSGCQSWYQTSDGKNTTLWPGSTIEYYRRTKEVNLEDFKSIF